LIGFWANAASAFPAFIAARIPNARFPVANTFKVSGGMLENVAIKELKLLWRFIQQQGNVTLADEIDQLGRADHRQRDKAHPDHLESDAYYFRRIVVMQMKAE